MALIYPLDRIKFWPRRAAELEVINETFKTFIDENIFVWIVNLKAKLIFTVVKRLKVDDWNELVSMLAETRVLNPRRPRTHAKCCETSFSEKDSRDRGALENLLLRLGGKKCRATENAALPVRHRLYKKTFSLIWADTQKAFEHFCAFAVTVQVFDRWNFWRTPNFPGPGN